MTKDQKIYLDYAATTPVAPEVCEAMYPYFSEKYGNPGSLHSFGQEAIAAVDRARETIAALIGARFDEVIFTSSATEANNLALRGIIRKLKAESYNLSPRIIVSAIEHKSVLDAAHELFPEVVELPVNREGIIDIEALKEALHERTGLVSVMYVNNEIGVVEPIAEIAHVIRERRASAFPLFHTDASHAFQHLPCNVNELGVDIMTLCAHKIYGPKGVGALYVRGGVDRSERRGTENVPAIVGFARAVELAAERRESEEKRIRKLLVRFTEGVKRLYPKAEINGPAAEAANRAPHIVNIAFPGKQGEELLIKLDSAGVAVSTGAACRSRAVLPSYVLGALGHPRERARASVRISFGAMTTEAEIDEAVQRLKSAL